MLAILTPTKLNGALVGQGKTLHAGDIIKFGREALRVDYIQVVGQPVPENGPASRDILEIDEEDTISFF